MIKTVKYNKDANKNYTNALGTVTGFGKTSDTGNLPADLKLKTKIVNKYFTMKSNNKTNSVCPQLYIRGWCV